MAMDDELARRSHALFGQAMSLDASKRQEFIHDACKGDERLHARVAQMMHALARSRDFLESPALGRLAREDNERTDQPVNEMVGDYCIIRSVGAGGMATVYEAIQKEPHRRVALKLMNQGLEKTSAVHRFKFETEVLARLHHPGIAQIFEAGMYDAGEGSRPFFVMEFVADARTITQQARERGLSLNDRLRMFLAVCDAVQHGHQLGVIHRDLKPGNILVGPDGRPKVIDFGVARSDDPGHAALTRHGDVGQLIGTLNYMSPEQCCAGPIDTRTDVYSLGVVLYELICDRLPHNLSQVPIPKALQIIHETVPDRPGTVHEKIPRDLDAIVMMAIDKDPDRRYRTAAALGADIRRYLNKQPVEARPATLIYQCRMFARRNRALVVSFTAVLLAILGGAAVSTSLAYRTMRESRRRSAAEQTAVQERDAARRQAYLANIAAAFSAHQTGEFQHLRTRLARAPENLRGWEWGMLAGMSERSSQTIPAHEDMIFGFDCSRDGKLLATGCNDGSIRIWETDTGACVTRMKDASRRPIHSVAFGPDGRWLVAGADDGTVSLWDIQSSKLARSVAKHNARVTSVSCSLSGVIAAASNDGIATIWDQQPNALRRTLSGVHGALISDDGQLLVAWNRNGAISLHAGNEETVSRQLSFDRAMECGAISPDNTLVAAGGADGRIAVWHTSTGALLHMLITPSSVSTVKAMTFSPLGDKLISAQIDRCITVWSIRTGERIETLRGHEEAVAGLRVSRDGHRLFSASWDKTIRTWGLDADARTDLVTRLAGHEGHVFSVCFSPDGSLVASASRDKSVRLWDPELGMPVGVLSGHEALAHEVCFSPDGLLIASGSDDKTVRLWNALTGGLADSLRAPAAVWSVTFSPDGQLLAAAAGDAILVWSLGSRDSPRKLSGKEGRVNQARFSPDGTKLATATRTGLVCLWDVRSGRPFRELTGHSLDVFALVFSHDGKLLYSGSRDQTVQIWNTESGRREEVLGGHGQLVTSLSLGPDGARLAAGSWFGEVVLWDPATRDLVASFKGHDAAIRSVAFSPSGRWLATGSHDGTIQLFDSALPKERLRLRAAAQGNHREAEALVAQLGRNLGTAGASALQGELERRKDVKSEIRAWARKLILQAALAQSASP